MMSESRNLLFLTKINFVKIRRMVTNLRASAELHPEILNKIENRNLKPRKHPGIIKRGPIALPEAIEDSIIKVIGDTPMKQLKKESAALSNFLLSRQVPPDEDEVNKKRKLVEEEVGQTLPQDRSGLNPEELDYYKQVMKSKVVNVLKQRVYNWKSVEYSRHIGLLYLVGQGRPEYAIVSRVLGEVQRYMNPASPISLFDFGSGVGIVRWAAQEIWKDSIKEYYCVDSCREMIDIATEIIETAGYDIKKSFFRQFLPSSHDRKYDIVICAHSLLELPSTSTRLQIITNLWNKTNKFLVLIERGSLAGFKVIHEARDFVLMNSHDTTSNELLAHIVAPCPHEFSCPRFDINDGTPCNFLAQYENKGQKEILGNESYTYVIIAKGKRNENDAQWPRIIRPVLNRSKHAICRLCTKSGQLQEVIISPYKPNRATYKCAKASRWGDLLPVNINFVEKKRYERIDNKS